MAASMKRKIDSENTQELQAVTEANNTDDDDVIGPVPAEADLKPKKQKGIIPVVASVCSLDRSWSLLDTLTVVTSHYNSTVGLLKL